MLYQDRHLTVFDKPAGLPTIPSRGGGPSLATETGLLVCHRLDAETTGVIVMARTTAGQRLVSAAFEVRRVEKVYLAVCRGELPDTGVCSVPLGEWRRGRVQIGQGRSAETAWTVRSRARGRLLVEARPRTGRTHQVRAHLAESGAPLLGDEAYGGESGHPLALHAWRLTLPWPGANDRLVLAAAPPPALEATWGESLAALEPTR